MKITFQEIRDYSPCGMLNGGKGWDKLITYYKPKDLSEDISIEEIIKSNGIQDAVWALRCLTDKEQLKKVYLFCADVAESVLHIYQNKYPKDMSVKNCINAVRDYANEKITLAELKVFKIAAKAAFKIAYIDGDTKATDAAYTSVYGAADADAYATAIKATDADARKSKWSEITKILINNKLI